MHCCKGSYQSIRHIYHRLAPYLCGSAKQCWSKVRATGSLKKSENVRDIFELPGLWNEFRGFWRFLFDSHIGPPENRPSLVQRIEETTTNLISSPPGLGPSNKNELQKLEDVLAKWMLRGWICSNKSFLHIQRSQLHLSHTSSVSHLTFPVQVMKDICTLQHPRLSYLLRRDISGLFSYLIFTHLNYLGVFLCPFLYKRFCRLHGHPILSVNALQEKSTASGRYLDVWNNTSLVSRTTVAL